RSSLLRGKCDAGPGPAERMPGDAFARSAEAPGSGPFPEELRGRPLLSVPARVRSKQRTHFVRLRCVPVAHRSAEQPSSSPHENSPGRAEEAKARSAEGAQGESKAPRRCLPRTLFEVATDTHLALFFDYSSLRCS